MTVNHVASARIFAPADFSFAQFTDAKTLGRWTLGSMELTETSLPGVYRGVSLFDGAESFVEIVPNLELLMIDYHVGTMESRQPRVSMRLTPGDNWGMEKDSCMAALSTWRAEWMDDERWQRTVITHDLEALLFKAQIETAWKLVKNDA